jgi:IS5 family transposase
LSLARTVRHQKQNQRGYKVYSLHAPEVECIGKGKAHKPYDFGVKLSVATTLSHAKRAQFVTHVKAMPGKPGACPPAGPFGRTGGTAIRWRWSFRRWKR